MSHLDDTIFLRTPVSGELLMELVKSPAFDELDTPQKEAFMQTSTLDAMIQFNMSYADITGGEESYQVGHRFIHMVADKLHVADAYMDWEAKQVHDYAQSTAPTESEQQSPMLGSLSRSIASELASHESYNDLETEFKLALVEQSNLKAMHDFALAQSPHSEQGNHKLALAQALITDIATAHDAGNDYQTWRSEQKFDFAARPIDKGLRIQAADDIRYHRMDKPMLTALSDQTTLQGMLLHLIANTENPQTGYGSNVGEQRYRDGLAYTRHIAKELGVANQFDQLVNQELQQERQLDGPPYFAL